MSHKYGKVGSSGVTVKLNHRDAADAGFLSTAMREVLKKSAAALTREIKGLSPLSPMRVPRWTFGTVIAHAAVIGEPAAIYIGPDENGNHQAFTLDNPEAASYIEIIPPSRLYEWEEVP